MKLKALAAAVVLAASLPASAVTVHVLGTLVADGSPSLFGGLVIGGAFDDIVTFTLTEHAKASMAVQDFSVLAPFLKTTLTSAKLTADPDGTRGNGDDHLIASSTVPGGDALVLSKQLDAGRYYFTVSGTGSGAIGGLGLYAGAVSAVATPVPEAETAAMLAAGLMSLLVLQRRRASP